MKSLLIDPQELAKRTKESARTVSLRIKEKTWLGFEQLAKENNTTANALISELADYYIESLNGSSLNLSDRDVIMNKFKTFLEKEVRKMCRWSINDVVMDLDTNCLFMLDRDHQSPFYAFVDMYMQSHATVDIDLDYLNQSSIPVELVNKATGEDFVVYPSKQERAEYYAGAYNPADGFSNVLYVPVKKAPDVIRLFKAIDEYAEKNDVTVEYDGDLMEKILIVINKYDYKCAETTSEREYRDIKYDENERRAMLNEIMPLILNATSVGEE